MIWRFENAAAVQIRSEFSRFGQKKCGAGKWCESWTSFRQGQREKSILLGTMNRFRCRSFNLSVDSLLLLRRFASPFPSFLLASSASSLINCISARAGNFPGAPSAPTSSHTRTEAESRNLRSISCFACRAAAQVACSVCAKLRRIAIKVSDAPKGLRVACDRSTLSRSFAAAKTFVQTLAYFRAVFLSLRRDRAGDDVVFIVFNLNRCGFHSLAYADFVDTFFCSLICG